MNFGDTFTDDFGQQLIVHSKQACSGHCPIHNPSQHVMTHYRLLWRTDVRIFERICPHGIGHNDPDELAWRKTWMSSEAFKYANVHGCDGCCVKYPMPTTIIT